MIEVPKELVELASALLINAQRLADKNLVMAPYSRDKCREASEQLKELAYS